LRHVKGLQAQFYGASHRRVLQKRKRESACVSACVFVCVCEGRGRGQNLLDLKQKGDNLRPELHLNIN
jgi:wyosine [tRNA(Phe)-imidazoG37] synthetase (radical SAM superfamily)